MQLYFIVVTIHLMNGVDRDVDKVFGASRRVRLVMDSLEHIISVRECFVSSRAVYLSRELRKRPHYHIRVWNATICERTSSSFFTIHNSMYSTSESVVAPYLKDIAYIDDKGALGRLDIYPFTILENLVPSTLILSHHRDTAAILMLARSYLFLLACGSRIAENFKGFDRPH